MDLEKVDLLTEIDSLRRGWQACEARLAAVEAERGAARAALAGASAKAKKISEDRDKAVARAEAERVKAEFELEEDNCPYVDLSCGTFAAERGIEVRPAGGPTYTTTVEHWQWLLKQLTAAQAGEARAMEVIQKLLKSAVPNRRDHPTMWDAWTFAETFIKNEQPAIDWLAQRGAESVATWIEKQVADNLQRYGTHYYERTTDDLLREAAALRAGKEVDNDPHA